MNSNARKPQCCPKSIFHNTIARNPTQESKKSDNSGTRHRRALYQATDYNPTTVNDFKSYKIKSKTISLISSKYATLTVFFFGRGKRITSSVLLDMCRTTNPSHSTRPITHLPPTPSAEKSRRPSHRSPKSVRHRLVSKATSPPPKKPTPGQEVKDEAFFPFVLLPLSCLYTRGGSRLTPLERLEKREADPRIRISGQAARRNPGVEMESVPIGNRSVRWNEEFEEFDAARSRIAVRMVPNDDVVIR